MLRTSSYTIYAELPGNPHELLLIHGISGAYDRVDRKVADYLRAHETRRTEPLYGRWQETPSPPSRISLSESTLERLGGQGYLTHLSPEEEEDFFARFAEKLHERARHQAPSYILMPTYDCNLRCGYCYQDHMRTDSRLAQLLAPMDEAMADRIFAALPAIESRHGLAADPSRRRNFGFFGGEPLLRANRKIVEGLIERARAAGPCDLWAITNGTELDAYFDLLGPQGIARLQITLDGGASMHDSRRIRPDGSGSFAEIAANIDRCLALGVEVGVRVNVDRKNLSSLIDLGDEIVARGWADSPRFAAYTAPVRGGNGKTEASETMSTRELDRRLAELRATYPQLRAIERPDEQLRERTRQMFDDPESIVPRMKPSFCGAHDRMYIFDPFGNIYACWERTGDARVRIGRLPAEGGVEMQVDQESLWRGRTVARHPICRRCRFALHCGGGCAVLALGESGEFGANYCDGFAARFRESVADAYLAHAAHAPLAPSREALCDL